MVNVNNIQLCLTRSILAETMLYMTQQLQLVTIYICEHELSSNEYGNYSMFKELTTDSIYLVMLHNSSRVGCDHLFVNWHYLSDFPILCHLTLVQIREARIIIVIVQDSQFCICIQLLRSFDRCLGMLFGLANL